MKCIGQVFVLTLLFSLGCGGNAVKPEVNPTDAATTERSAAKVKKVLAKDEGEEILRSVNELIGQGEFGKAKTALEDAMGFEADDNFKYFASYNLGVLCERLASYGEAKNYFEIAKGLQPKNGLPVIALARLSARAGSKGAGIELARSALEAHPDSTSLQNALNRLYVESGEALDSVVSSSKKILVKDENNAEAMLNLAIAYQLQKRHDMALDVLSRAEADFKSPRADLVWRKAKSMLALDQSILARNVITKALETGDTSTPELHNLMGLLDLKNGNPEAAESHFRKALSIRPTMIEACVNLSHALKAGQKYDEALSTLNRCSDESGGKVEMLFNLGILYLDGKFTRIQGLKQVERAKAYFEEFIQKTDDAERKSLATTYLGESEKRIKYELKKAELKLKAQRREEARKAREAEEAKKPKSESVESQEDDENTDGDDDGDDGETADEGAKADE